MFDTTPLCVILAFVLHLSVLTLQQCDIQARGVVGSICWDQLPDSEDPPCTCACVAGWLVTDARQHLHNGGPLSGTDGFHRLLLCSDALDAYQPSRTCEAE